MVDEFLMGLLRPAPQKSFITPDDLESAERHRTVLCDEAHMKVFATWYLFGGMQRPLTPVEAAEMPADLAQDFTYMINRIRQLSDDRMGMDEWVNRNIYKNDPKSPYYAAETMYPAPNNYTYAN